jgi:hypothetical protein
VAGVFALEDVLVLDEALEADGALGIVAGRFTAVRMLVSEAMGLLLWGKRVCHWRGGLSRFCTSSVCRSRKVVTRPLHENR